MASSSSILLLFSFFLLPILLLLFFNRKTSSRLPPGSTGLPLLGETLRMITAYRSGHPEPFVDDRLLLHKSRLFTSHLFGELTVFSADPDFNRLLLAGEGRTFESSYPSCISTLLGRRSLLLMKGALHKRMHSLILTRFASPQVIRNSLLPGIDRLIRVNMRSWGGRIRLLDQAKKVSFEMMVEQTMSERPGEWTEDLRRHYNALIDGFFSVPLFPVLGFTTYGKAIKVSALKRRCKIRSITRHKQFTWFDKDAYIRILLMKITSTPLSWRLGALSRWLVFSPSSLQTAAWRRPIGALFISHIRTYNKKKEN